MTDLLPAETDLSTMFGIDIVGEHASAADPSAVLCPKCKGQGNFRSYTDRVVGQCFACNGTGLAPNIGVTVKEGDCLKCAGTGAWRSGRPCFACDGTGKALMAREAEINVNAIAVAFTAALNHGIKRPKLRLDTFTFSRAPDHGRNAGSIYVTMAKGGEYLGKVTAGQFFPTRSCDDLTRDRVIAVASAPHDAAKAYGLRTGECSCCGRTLTNGESVDLGIGPICREKFGWGLAA